MFICTSHVQSNLIKQIIVISVSFSTFMFIIYILMIDKSYFLYFSIANFHYFLLQLLFCCSFMIKATSMILRQSVLVAVNETTSTFDTQEPYFFFTVMTSLLSFLLFYGGFTDFLFYFIGCLFSTVDDI